MERQPVIFFPPQARTSVIVQKSCPSQDNSSSAADHVQQQQQQQQHQHHDQQQHYDQHQQGLPAQSSFDRGLPAERPSADQYEDSQHERSRWNIDNQQESPTFAMKGTESAGGQQERLPPKRAIVRPSILKNSVIDSTNFVEMADHSGRKSHPTTNKMSDHSCQHNRSWGSGCGCCKERPDYDKVGYEDYRTEYPEQTNNKMFHKNKEPHGYPHSMGEMPMDHQQRGGMKGHNLDHHRHQFQQERYYQDQQSRYPLPHHPAAYGGHHTKTGGHSGHPPSMYYPSGPIRREKRFKNSASPPYPPAGYFCPPFSPSPPHEGSFHCEQQACSKSCCSSATNSSTGDSCLSINPAVAAAAKTNSPDCLSSSPAAAAAAKLELMKMAAATGNKHSYKSLYNMIYKQALADVCAGDGPKPIPPSSQTPSPPSMLPRSMASMHASMNTSRMPPNFPPDFMRWFSGKSMNYPEIGHRSKSDCDCHRRPVEHSRDPSAGQLNERFDGRTTRSSCDKHAHEDGYYRRSSPYGDMEESLSHGTPPLPSHGPSPLSSCNTAGQPTANPRPAQFSNFFPHSKPEFLLQHSPSPSPQYPVSQSPAHYPRPSAYGGQFSPVDIKPPPCENPAAQWRTTSDSNVSLDQLEKSAKQLATLPEPPPSGQKERQDLVKEAVSGGGDCNGVQVAADRPSVLRKGAITAAPTAGLLRMANQASVITQPKEMDTSEVEMRTGSTWYEEEDLQATYEDMDPDVFIQRTLDEVAQEDDITDTKEDSESWKNSGALNRSSIERSMERTDDVVSSQSYPPASPVQTSNNMTPTLHMKKSKEVEDSQSPAETQASKDDAKFNELLEEVVFKSGIPELKLDASMCKVKREIEDTDSMHSNYNSETPLVPFNTSFLFPPVARDQKPDLDAYHSLAHPASVSPSYSEPEKRERRRRRKSEIESGSDKRPISDCKVCGDQAIAHMHYGGICCYSCKAFFRRAVQSGKDKKYRCKADGDCTVSMNNRRGCQKCRFQKCIQIGMVPSWVLSDEQCEKRFGKSRLKRKGGYPNIKKETQDPEDMAQEQSSQNHLHQQQQQQHQQPQQEAMKMAAKARPPPPQYLTLTDTDELSIEYMSCVYEASKEMISFSEENSELWNKLFAEKSASKHEYSSSEMTSLIQTVVKKNIFFLEANSYFKKLSFEDKRKLLRKNMSQMGQLRGALRFDMRDKKFLWYFNQKEKGNVKEKENEENKKIGEKDLGKFYKSATAASGVIKVMERIGKVGLTSEAILILMHIVIFSTDDFAEEELEMAEFVERVQITYFNLLHRYIMSIMDQDKTSIMISKIMTLLVDLRQLCEEAENSESG